MGVIFLSLLGLFAMMTNIVTASKPCKSNGECANKMDEALTRIKLNYNESNWNTSLNLTIKYKYKECIDCDLKVFTILTIENNYTHEAIIKSYYSYIFQIVSSDGLNSCGDVRVNNIKEFGEYNLNIEPAKNASKCEWITINVRNFDSTYYLYIALVIVIFLLLGYNLTLYLYRRYKEPKTVSIDIELTDKTNEQVDSSKSVKKRLESLDTFRGISLFIMIFVNYGSGGYKFLEHQPWNGIALADFVYPWFLFIMGMSMFISINSLIQKQTKLDCLKKIIIRFIKIFCIGILLNGFYGIELKNLRIFGVLQRIAVCYLITGLIEVLSYDRNIKNYIENDNKYKKFFCDLIWSWKQWICNILILAIWFLITYLLNVPNCGKGYMGPGGLHKNSSYYNCTGGAAGYIDKIILGTSHLYGYPTCQEIYKTGAFDPEGILSTLTSIFSTYLGVQAARIIIFYENPTQRIKYWSFWGIFYFAMFSLTSFYDLENGPIPVNKNLWTPSFALLTGFPAFVLITILYFIIDVKKYWNGAPLKYLGMNSIIIYVIHSLFSTAFPLQWIVPNTHVELLFMHLWGSIFLTIVATYFYYKKIFFNL